MPMHDGSPPVLQPSNEHPPGICRPLLEPLERRLLLDGTCEQQLMAPAAPVDDGSPAVGGPAADASALLTSLPGTMASAEGFAYFNDDGLSDDTQTFSPTVGHPWRRDDHRNLPDASYADTPFIDLDGVGSASGILEDPADFDYYRLVAPATASGRLSLTLSGGGEARSRPTRTCSIMSRATGSTSRICRTTSSPSGLPSPATSTTCPNGEDFLTA